MRNVKSTLKLIGQCGLAVIVLSLFSISYAAPTVGSSVKDAQGQVIGTIMAPMESSAKLSPTYVIQLNNGGKQFVSVQNLQEQGDSVQLSAPLPATNSPELAELRQMTMVMVMQDHEDAGMLGDIAKLSYHLQGDVLTISGTLDSDKSLQRLITATAELCDYVIAANITIRPKIAS